MYKLSFWVFLLPLTLQNQAFSSDNKLKQLSLPPGFSIMHYATGITNARQIDQGPDQILFAGSRAAGNVYRVLPPVAQKPSKVEIIDQNLKMPSGLTFHNNALYVADIDTVYRYTSPSGSFKDKLIRKVFISGLPSDKHHGWKFIKFGPDNHLYVPVGAPCNVCLEKDPRYATILRFSPDGKSWEIYASGVRNSVGFDWHPTRKTLWFTDNGRDLLGDHLPPDKLNHAWRKGLHFGFPWYHGQDKSGKAILDPFYKTPPKDLSISKSALHLPAHVAPLGMVFYTGTMFPKKYQQQILIPEHGSWNSSKKVGYRVTLATLDSNQKVTSYEPFITGWTKNEEAWGRPVALLNLPDGSLLLSDDDADAIYRITYKK